MPPGGASMDANADWVRWNGHLDLLVEVEVMDHVLKLEQAPSSNDLGKTVWDASIVLAQFLAQNSRKGEFSRQRLKGKRAIELGAGMGLGGFAMAMLGCNIILTDLGPVLPLLQRNYEKNLSPSALRAMSSPLYGNVGAIEVRPLDWGKPEQRQVEGGPWDYILAAGSRFDRHVMASLTFTASAMAADCIYHEHIIEGLLQTCLCLCSPKTTVIIVNELRSESVQGVFLRIFGEHFSIKKISSSKFHPVYQHPTIQIFQLKLLRKRSSGTGAEGGSAQLQDPTAAAASNSG